MLESLSQRLTVDNPTAEAFIENVQRFAESLSADERAILDALIQAAMDPWSRSLLQPPNSVTPEEAGALDRIVAAREGEG